MKPKTLATIAAVTALVGAGVGIGLSGLGEKDGEIGSTELTAEEYTIGDRCFVSASGNTVRLVGVSEGKELTEAGNRRFVSVSKVPPTAQCSVVYELAPKQELPATPEFSKEIEKGIWWGIFRGEECQNMAGFSGYLGSSMAELDALPQAKKDKVLRDDGNGTLYFEHSILGRPDLSFMPIENGTVKPRYEMEEAEVVEMEIQ